MRVQLHDLVAHSAERGGDTPALTVKDTTLTYGELWDEVARAGAGLRRLGLGRGERVAVYLDKRVETIAAIFGTSAAGGAFVPVNPLLRARQVAYILADCDVRVLVTTPERFAVLRPELDSCKALEHVVVVGSAPAPVTSEPRSAATRTDGTDAGGAARAERAPIGTAPEAPSGAGYTVTEWAALRDGAPAEPAGAGGIDADVAAIFYTSGSTGKPKGVVLSHRNLVVGAESVSSYLGNTADDVIASVLPLSFDAGFSQLTTGFLAGAHVILVNYLAAADVVKACAKHGVTGLTCVPPLWIQLTELSWPEEASRSLRYFANTGGRMPKATLDRLRATFPQALPFLMYGLTEAFRSTYLDPAQVDRRPDSIGKAIPNAEILIVREDGTVCDPGEPGELVHRGALVALGYWNDPERTAERFKPAPGREAGICATEVAVWSGDVAVRDEEGFLYFVGRKDEMIKTSGYRVSPTEIEEVVYDTGLVRDAVALGVEDDRLGQRVVVVVSPPAGGEVDAAALQAELRKRLPRYMVPDEISVRPELPRSPNGKFDRNLLRQELGQ